MARDSQAALVALQSLRIRRARRRVGRFRQRGLRSPRFRQGGNEPAQRRAARSARACSRRRRSARRCSTISSRSSRRATRLPNHGRRPPAATEGPHPPSDAKGQRRNLSLNSIAMDMAPKEPPAKPPEERPTRPSTAMSPETMQPAAPKPPPQPLNIIQKTFRAEALARLQRAIIADCGFTERLVVFWSNHFCISANKGGVARMWAGSFEREAIRPLRARALRRHAESGRAASGDAVLSRQPAIAGAGFARREKPQPRPERKSRARNPGAAYARRRRRLFAGRRDVAGAHHHRVDLCRTAGPARRARHLRVQRQCAPARRACA